MTSSLLALLAAVPHTPSRLESVLWWLPLVSIAAVAAMVGSEVVQSLPEDHRFRRAIRRWIGPLALGAAVVVLLNVVRAADIVGFL